MSERDLTTDRGVPLSGYPLQQEKPAQTQTQDTARGETASSPNAAARDLRDRASADLQSVKQTAKDELSGAADAARNAVSSQKNVIATKLGGFASALEKVSDELDRDDQGDIGKLTRNIGGRMRSFSEEIKDRDMSEVLQMSQDFGRKQPLAFLALAAVAGLAASRLMVASSDHGHTPAKPGSNTTGAGSMAGTGSTTGGNLSTGSGRPTSSSVSSSPSVSAGTGVSTGTGVTVGTSPISTSNVPEGRFNG